MSFRILMISPQFMPEVFGGAEQQCFRLSQVLARRGHHIRVLTSRSERQTPARENIDGLEIIRLWSHSPPQRGGVRLGSSIAWVRQVCDWIGARRDEFDFLHMHQAKVNAVAGAICGRRFGIPTVAKLGNAGRGMDLLTLKRKRPFYGNYCAKFVRRNIDSFVAISSCIERELGEFGVDQNKISFIPNGIDIPDVTDDTVSDAVAKIRREWGLEAGQQACLFAGRLEKQKNVPFLIDVFAQLSRTHPEAVLLLMGDGEEREALEVRAYARGVRDKVRFLGKLDNVRQYMRAADFFVLPAKTEGLSNALLEAMSVGLLPISSRVSGSIDVIRDGENGWLFDVGDEASMLQAWLRALKVSSDKRNTMRAAAMQVIAQSYNIEIIADQYELLYSKLLQERGIAPAMNPDFDKATQVEGIYAP